MFCLTLANTFHHLVTTAFTLQTLQCASDLVILIMVALFKLMEAKCIQYFTWHLL